MRDSVLTDHIWFTNVLQNTLQRGEKASLLYILTTSFLSIFAEQNYICLKVVIQRQHSWQMSALDGNKTSLACLIRPPRMRYTSLPGPWARGQFDISTLLNTAVTFLTHLGQQDSARNAVQGAHHLLNLQAARREALVGFIFFSDSGSDSARCGSVRGGVVISTSCRRTTLMATSCGTAVFVGELRVFVWSGYVWRGVCGERLDGVPLDVGVASDVKARLLHKSGLD